MSHPYDLSLAPLFLLTGALVACGSDDVDPGNGAQPDAGQPEASLEAGEDVVSDVTQDAPSPSCAPLTCPIDDTVEPAATGDYRHFTYTTGVSVAALDLSANGRRIVVGDQAGDLHLFEHDGEGTPRWTFSAPDSQAQFNSVAIDRDGRTLAATDGLTSVYLFTCDDGSPIWTFDSQATTDPFVAVAMSDDGCHVAAISTEKVYLFDRDAVQPVAIHEPTISRGAWLTTVAIAGDGSRVAAGTWISDPSGAELFVFDASGQLGSYPTDYASQTSNAVLMPIAMSSDGSKIAAGGADKRIHFFDGSFSPAWSYDVGTPEGSVWSLAMSDDGSRLFASAGEDNATLFHDTASATPTWSYDGTSAAPHASGVGIHDPYSGGDSAEGPFGIGAYPGTIALSADGKYPVVGAWNSGNLFGMYAEKDRPFRVYHATSDSDPINVVGISADGAWIAAGTTFGEVLAWEVAPAVMIEIGTPVTVNIPSNPSASDKLNLDDVNFERTIVKPGRAANMKETWSLWAMVAGVLVPPEAAWLVSPGDFVQEHTRTLADGNFDETTSESMPVPQIWQSPISAVTGFLLRVELEDDGNGTLTSDEAAPFVDVQVGGE